MHISNGYAFRNSYAGQKEMAELAFSLLTMRANTPPGSWVDDHYASAYGAVRAKARSLAGTEGDEEMFLSVLNLAQTLLRLLVASTGIEQEGWLVRLHEDFIEPIDPKGIGVWGPHELQV